MAESDCARLAADIFLPEKVQIMVEAMLAVAGNGVTSGDGIDRANRLEKGLHEGLTPVRVNCRKHQEKPCLPENKVLLFKLIDEDLKDYSQRLFAAAVSTDAVGPPAIETMHAV